MLSSTSRWGAIGAAAALSLGAAQYAAAQTSGQDLASPQSLNTSSSVSMMRGALSPASPPEYDGPVKWQFISYDPETRALLGFPLAGLFVGGVIGAAAAGKYDPNGFRKFAGGAAIGAILGIVGAAYTLETGPKKIEFQTTVSDVLSSSAPHQELVTVRSGKTSRQELQGPYYGELVRIPESDLALAVNNFGAPLVVGQNLNAVFYLDKDSHRILYWSASAEMRPGN